MSKKLRYKLEYSVNAFYRPQFHYGYIFDRVNSRKNVIYSFIRGITVVVHFSFRQKKFY